MECRVRKTKGARVLKYIHIGIYLAHARTFYGRKQIIRMRHKWIKDTVLWPEIENIDIYLLAAYTRRHHIPPQRRRTKKICDLEKKPHPHSRIQRLDAVIYFNTLGGLIIDFFKVKFD